MEGAHDAYVDAEATLAIFKSQFLQTVLKDSNLDIGRKTEPFCEYMRKRKKFNESKYNDDTDNGAKHIAADWEGEESADEDGSNDSKWKSVQPLESPADPFDTWRPNVEARIR